MKTIEFIPSSKECELYVKRPMPGKNYIPNWYKEIKPVTEKSLSFNHLGAELNIKMCMPFLDSMMTGYIQETWCDIFIEYKNNEIHYRYSENPEIVSIRDKVSIPLGNEYYPYEFVWKEPWSVKLPKGYSAIITHPFNSVNLPFVTLTGIVDADNYYHTRLGNHPFYIKKDFEGIIPAGTPMYQIIPFKRDSWESIESRYDHDLSEKRHYMIGRKFFGSYKTLFWQKKEYN
jgi:hypothetical protein